MNQQRLSNLFKEFIAIEIYFSVGSFFLILNKTDLFKSPFYIILVYGLLCIISILMYKMKHGEKFRYSKTKTRFLRILA